MSKWTIESEQVSKLAGKQVRKWVIEWVSKCSS